MTDLTQFARLDSSLLHTRLLAGARQVGGIYQLDFQHALISTDDKWKADAGGIPLHSYRMPPAALDVVVNGWRSGRVERGAYVRDE